MSFLTIILALLGLGFLVFIHELGHYFAARRVGIKVEAFSIGFGKPIISWIRKDVEWRVGWLPFGGYVRMAGMEKQGDMQPHEIPGGFFAARPIDRIKVALAGPIVNIVFAFLVLCLIWAIGGREKPFSDTTNRVGWVDQGSELYQDGLRPGDIISQYDGHPLRTSKDHLYAAMLGGEGVRVEGFLVDYPAQSMEPFRFEVDPYDHPESLEKGLRTIGILRPAQYLIYEPGATPFPPGSPMANSGIEPSDRLFWVDGDLIFSLEQLSTLLNQGKALLTIERGGETLLARVPRVPVSDLALKRAERAELSDWHYAARMSTRLGQTLFIPYNLSDSGVIEGKAHFVDPDTEVEVFPAHSLSKVEAPLQVGDRIVAVDGVPLRKGNEILQALQTHKTHIIVQRRDTAWSVLPSRAADRRFDETIDWSNLSKLAAGIGRAGPEQEGNLVLLKPVEPVPMSTLIRASGQEAAYEEQLAERRAELEGINDPKQRALLMQKLERSQNQLMLGLNLQDRLVNYNPSPNKQFGYVMVESWRTIQALFSGYLSPKWLAGPVGIIQVMQHGWSIGLAEALFWLAVISLNLGVLNLLPVPVLDGGHVAFSLWEMITKRRIKAETMERLVIPFVILLIGFFIFVTYHDLSRLFRGLF